MNKNNKGYSLVELIIVVAIISVIGLAAMLSVRLILNANARSCANSITGAISECKIATMSKGQGNVRLILYRDGANGNIMCDTQIKTGGTWISANGGPEKVGASKCYVGSADGANNLPDSDSEAWTICFDRSTGALGKLTDGTSQKIGGSENYADGNYQIWVSGGSRKYCIEIERLTGKQKMENKG